ncbi:putative T7SS-secreted protein [Nocardia sp. BMG51109]|uniref:putative T7SS-secreted protein n=1 Tax=Nocardia sp. BMG51109 TaxID=1056816 RepID=UPI0004668A4F|nr:DUF6531 domain-containing protein [Nocardia sp. BMG51109]
MGVFDGIGDAVEGAVESVTEKAGDLADTGLDKAAAVSRWAGAGGVAETLDDLGDRLVDLTGGEVDERELGDSEDPRELVRGDPAAISRAAEQLKQMGDSISRTGDALRKVDIANWSGQTADAFRTEFAEQPKLWWDGSDAMHAAAGVLDAWFHEVTAAQTKAADAIAQWKQAEAEERAKKTAWNALTGEQKTTTPLVDTWTVLRDAARETLRGARMQRDNAATAAVGRLSGATESAPTEPPFTERMAANFSDLNAAGEHAKLNFTKGLLTSATGIVQFVRQVSPMDTYNLTHPAAYMQGMSDLGTGMVVAAADPGATVSALVSDARKNPAEFAGALTGDLVTTVGTGGAGAAKPALSAVREVSEVSRVTHAATNIAEHAPGRGVPHAPETPTGTTPHAPEPPTGTAPRAPETPTSTPRAPETPAGTTPHDPGTHTTSTSPGPSGPRPAETSTAPHEPGPSPSGTTRPDGPADTGPAGHAGDTTPSPRTGETPSQPTAPESNTGTPDSGGNTHRNDPAPHADTPAPESGNPRPDGTQPGQHAAPEPQSSPRTEPGGPTRPHDTAPAHPDAGPHAEPAPHSDTAAPDSGSPRPDRTPPGQHASPETPDGRSPGPSDGHGPPRPETPATHPEPRESAHPGEGSTPHQPESATPADTHPHPTTNDQPHPDSTPSHPDSTQPDPAHPDPSHPADSTGPHDGVGDHHPGPDQHANRTPEQRADADHGAHDTATESGPEHDRTENQKTCSEDPVDIATGEFLLPETDADLPGVLRLVLRRTHRSNYRYGRWFGPSWSATLDMRLVVEHEGVTFLGEDGIMLAYPHTEPGLAVPPVTGGQRWTLTRTDTGGYRVWDQQRELIWHFAPEPGLGGIESRLGNYALSAVTDRHRNRIRFHYDTTGAPTEVSHSGGYRVLVDTESGRVTGLSVLDRDVLVRVREFAYNAGELISVTNGVAATTRYTYDDHRMTTWTDSNGNQMVNTYDESGRVLFQRGTAGVLDTDFDYLEFPDHTGSLTTVTDSLGATTQHGFDHDLQLRDLVDPAGGRTHIDYNDDRRPLRVAAPDGAVTHYTYTGEGDIAKVTRPDGHTISLEYTFRNRPTRILDADGSVRQQEWNNDGDLAATIDAAGARTEYTHHPNGAVALITESTGARTSVETDAAGLPIRVADPNGAVTHIDRDGFGRPLAVTDPLGATTRHEWSATGKLVRRTDADGHVETWTYDGEGNVLTHTDRAGGVTRFAYGAFDLLASRTEPDGSVTRYTWDAQRRLTSVTNPLAQRWTYEYDPAGRLIAETDYTGATTRYTYDNTDRVATVTPATGVTRHHTHDILGRLTGITADTGEYIRYTHDSAGRVLTAVTGTGEEPTHKLEFTYTPAGNIASQQLDDQPPMRHVYDQHGRRTQRTTPSGATTTWEWDYTNRIQSLSADGHTVDFTYDRAGRPTGWKIGEIAVHRTLTSIGRITEQTVTAHPPKALNFGRSDRPAPQNLRHDEFAYRPDGYLSSHTVTRAATPPEHRDYTLDQIGRVTAITRNGTLTEAYTYDPLSNITSSLPDHPTPASPDPTPTAHREYHNNLLIRNGRTRYHYDESGRLTRKETTRLSHKPDIWHYRYNAFDQLTDVYTPDRQWWRYTYDAMGRRVTKQLLRPDHSALQRTDYTWDGTQLVEQSAADYAIRWSYWPGTSIPIAQSLHQGATEVELHCIITDLAGAPTELILPSTAESSDFAVIGLWGRAAWWSTDGSPLRFAGQVHDPETDLHYNLHRFYDPSTARYLTQDPLGLAAAPNPISYPHNPTTWTDPLGLMPESCGHRDFAHGTSLGHAENIMNNGISAEAGQAATHGGSMSRPGSFFTHEVAGGQSPGFQSAYEWGLRVDPNSPSTVIVGRLPEATYQSLREGGLIEIRGIGEGVPDETIFHPRSFEILNREMEWIAKVTP